MMSFKAMIHYRSLQTVLKARGRQLYDFPSFPLLSYVSFNKHTHIPCSVIDMFVHRRDST